MNANNFVEEIVLTYPREYKITLQTRKKYVLRSSAPTGTEDVTALTASKRPLRKIHLATDKKACQLGLLLRFWFKQHPFDILWNANTGPHSSSTLIMVRVLTQRRTNSCAPYMAIFITGAMTAVFSNGLHRFLCLSKPLTHMWF